MKQFIYIATSLLLCFSWTKMEAQKTVSIHYPFGYSKTSQDNGKTWEEKQNKNVTFNYPFQVKKVSSDNGKTWKTSELGKIVISYPNGYRKTSLDKGKTWIVEQMGENMGHSVSAFPIPAQNYVELESEDFNSSYEPQLVDLSGREIGLPSGSEFVNNHKYHLSTGVLKNGYYVIRFQTNYGPVISKIMVQN